jgi:hypothetical protein
MPVQWLPLQYLPLLLLVAALLLQQPLLTAAAAATAAAAPRPGPRGATASSATTGFDVLGVVYGATSGGVMAAVAAARNGSGRVALLDPGSRIGGMTTGGLSATDVGKSQVVGGMALELYQQNGRHYLGKPVEFNWEPHVALWLLHELVRNASVTLFEQAQVDSHGR